MTTPSPHGSTPLSPETPARPGVGHLPPLDTSYDRDRHRRKAPLGWLPLALLIALLGLLGLMLLAGALAGKDDSDPRAGAGGGAAAQGSETTGRLTVGSTDVLQDAGTIGRIGSLTGQDAVGRGVLVQQVVSDEGFWVGASSAERVFVFLTPEARGAAGESPFQVRTGQRIDLNGSLVDLRGDAGDLGVTDAEGATQLEKQGAYVSATQVRLSS
jgi:hypothetical protein